MASPRTITPEARARANEARAAARAIARAVHDHDSVSNTRIPDPAMFARLLPLDLATILIGATPRVGSFIVHHSRIHELRSMGLAEYGGNCLTTFGIHVRKHLIEEDA